MKKIRLAQKDYIYLSVIAVLLAASVILSGFLVLAKSKENDAISYYDMKCNAFKIENINVSDYQIVFIGDSITDGYRLDSYYSDLPLATYNRGISGDTTDGVLGRLGESAFDFRPVKIVLMIGTNDIGRGSKNGEILDNYREILSKIKGYLTDTEVYCMSIIPQNNILENKTKLELERRTKQILEVNEGIKDLADEFDYQYVNLFDRLADDKNLLKNEYTEDGLHLNHEGYLVWTAILKPLLA